ncbi:MAG: alpha/beta fold hydrolase [Pyrinomonadaceae bacterium]
MLKLFALALLASMAAGVFGQNQTDNSARAKSFIDALAKKDFASAENYFNDDVKSKISADKLAEIWDSLTAQVGDFKLQGKVLKTQKDNLEIFLIMCEFEKANLDIQTAFDAQGKIAGLFFLPLNARSANAAQYETPDYANPNLFTEKEVTVGAGEWALPATLTMPKDKTNVPVVILVHGSGMNDRDETIGGNKVFKDLAWGLASKGIAVLRYDKRTLVHRLKFAAIKNVTVNDEAVDDALFAVQLLRQTSNVDAKKIFVLGHSLGGMLIPRIGERDKNIAGLIIFAGTARPLEDVVVEQYNYLAALDETPSEKTRAQLDTLQALAEKTKNLKSTDAPYTPTLFNLPVSYWIDLNNYNPPQAAENLTEPMLILQGESDYQVTMRDFQLWKNALGSHKNVMFKSYPKLTHLFMETRGAKPSPRDYEQTSHVNAQVVDDIADWILKTAR